MNVGKIGQVRFRRSLISIFVAIQIEALRQNLPRY